MNVTTIIGLLGFGPGLVLLYFVLGRYEWYFKDNKAFFMVILGLFVGLIVGVVSNTVPMNQFFWTLIIVFSIEIIKFFILLQKPFRLEHDATFYGMALGIGTAAMLVFVYSFGALDTISTKTAVFILLISYNYTLINASTGALIGFGSYKGDFWRYLFRSFVMHGIHGFLMTWVWNPNFALTTKFGILALGGIYVTLVLIYIIKDIIPKTIPKELKRARKRALMDRE